MYFYTSTARKLRSKEQVSSKEQVNRVPALDALGREALLRLARSASGVRICTFLTSQASTLALVKHVLFGTG